MTAIINAVTHPGPSSCRIPATWFTLVSETECTDILDRWRAGDEIAAHTVSHLRMFAHLPHATLSKEILGSRQAILECGLPDHAVRGFRGPHLVHGPAARKILFDHGFLYDSSIVAYNLNVSHRLWPYTMDKGIPQNCYSVKRKSAVCEEGERYPGMWEIPVGSIRVCFLLLCFSF